MTSRSIWLVTLTNLTLLLAFLCYFFFIKVDRIAYVDSNKLISGYQGMIDARKLYEGKSAAWTANIDTLTKSIQRDILKIESKSTPLKEKQNAKELITLKQKQLVDYRQAVASQAEQENDRITEEIFAKINKYLKKYGEQHGYLIIHAATQFGNVAYADSSIEITDKVLEGLNNEYSGR